jgi:flagellar hook-length control protein FliK
MAAIVNSGGSPSAGAAPVAPTGSGAPPGLPTQSTSNTPQDVFIQLIAAMTGASGQGQATAPTLSGLDLTGGDQIELPGEGRDSDTDDTDDDESGALAMEALLQGLASFLPAAPAGNQTTDAKDAIAALQAFLTKGADLDISQTAADKLTGDGKDATGNSPLTDSDATNSTANAQNTPAPPQIHALLTAHTAAGDVDVTPDATLRSPVGTPPWKDELGTQLTWMAINGREAASLKLSPEHLGPLDIRISMHEGEASVYFGAANPDTRSALEQSLPRLRAPRHGTPSNRRARRARRAVFLTLPERRL